MKVIRLLVYLVSFFPFDARYSLYHFDDCQVSYPTFDCLYAYVISPNLYDYEPFVRAYHLIPYCRRPDIDEKQAELKDESHKNFEIICFTELKKQNVTSEQLLAWSATMNITERYESANEGSHGVFYNCSPPWFGSLCQYRFEFDTAPASFGDLVLKILGNHFQLTDDDAIITCYTFLPHCYGHLSIVCLDWREICDGKVHCFAGEDEQMCDELEKNECADDEYRCHFGGQCIPLAFVFDGRASMDCLDGTDESGKTYRLPQPDEIRPCDVNPAFECEERTCRLVNSFSCGDGDCIYDYALARAYSQCDIRRDKIMTDTILNSLDLISNINCQQLGSCLIKRSLKPKTECIITYKHFANITSNELLDKHCSSQWLVLPVEPIIYGFFQFVYLTNRSFTEMMETIIPDFICFDPQKCSGLLAYIIFTGMNTRLACIRIVDVTSESNIDAGSFWWIHLKDMRERCLGIGTERSCSHPSLFHCDHSSKCISRHRLVDGSKDCYYGEDESYPACQLNDSQRFPCSSEANKCLSRVAIGNLM